MSVIYLLCLPCLYISEILPKIIFQKYPCDKDTYFWNIIFGSIFWILFMCNWLFQIIIQRQGKQKVELKVLEKLHNTYTFNWERVYTDLNYFTLQFTRNLKKKIENWVTMPSASYESWRIFRKVRNNSWHLTFRRCNVLFTVRVL